MRLKENRPVGRFAVDRDDIYSSSGPETAGSFCHNERKGHTMRLMYGSALAVAIAVLAPPVIGAQGQEANRTVSRRRNHCRRLAGKADGAGQVNDAKLSQEGRISRSRPARR